MIHKRWTLAVVCVATAMLMLDIAVVNTALSRMAEDLDAGLSGLQWVVDAYTLALAAVVLTAGSLAEPVGRVVPWAVEALEYLDRRAASGAAGDCPLPELFAFAGMAFALDESFSIYGGNIKSTMAGEFSFSFALWSTFIVGIAWAQHGADIDPVDHIARLTRREVDGDLPAGDISQSE
jgi:MFS family permease